MQPGLPNSAAGCIVLDSAGAKQAAKFAPFVYLLAMELEKRCLFFAANVFVFYSFFRVLCLKVQRLCMLCSNSVAELPGLKI